MRTYVVKVTGDATLGTPNSYIVLEREGKEEREVTACDNPVDAAGIVNALNSCGGLPRDLTNLNGLSVMALLELASENAEGMETMLAAVWRRVDGVPIAWMMASLLHTDAQSLREKIRHYRSWYGAERARAAEAKTALEAQTETQIALPTLPPSPFPYDPKLENWVP